MKSFTTTSQSSGSSSVATTRWRQSSVIYPRPTSGTSPVFTSKPVRVRDLHWKDHLRERVKNILPRLSSETL